MGKFEEVQEHLQFERPYLYGALVGVLFTVFSFLFDLVFGFMEELSTIVFFGFMTVIVFGLFFGLTAKDRRRRRDENRGLC